MYAGLWQLLLLLVSIGVADSYSAPWPALCAGGHVRSLCYRKLPHVMSLKPRLCGPFMSHAGTLQSSVSAFSMGAFLS